MALRFIPTKAHGVADSVTAGALVAAPELFRLDRGSAAAIAPRANGAAAGVYSLLTDYELGARRVLPMRAHLALDAAAGVALASVPWLTGNARRGVRNWLPHALVGATEVGFALLTKTEPPAPKRRRLARLLRRSA